MWRGIARTEAEARAAGRRRSRRARAPTAAMPSSGLHRRERIEVVRTRDAGEIGVEAVAVRAADDPLQHDGHLLFLEPVRARRRGTVFAAWLKVDA